MKIFEIVEAIKDRLNLSEMAKDQKRVIHDMEGFCFQIAVHVTKLFNTPDGSDELINKWIRDITKHCNLLHREHQNNGRYPIQFKKIGNYRPLIDHSLAKIRSELKGYNYTSDDRELEYSDFIRRVLSFSQHHYDDVSPFTSEWVRLNLDQGK